MRKNGSTSQWLCARVIVPLLAPIVLCTVVYWNGIWVWFQQDDFAWLSLYSRITKPIDLPAALLQPAAQGTIRPLSERLFFTGMYAVWGLEAVPYRCVVFLTHYTGLVLFVIAISRISGSMWAGTAAAVLWCSNSVLSWPLSWTAAYNQILCATVFLLCLYCLQRFCETRERRYERLHWLVFLAGFGVLETNAVYPLVAVAFTVLFSPQDVQRCARMIPASMVFSIVHFFVAPKSSAGTYGIAVDYRLPTTLLTYYRNAFLPDAGRAILGWETFEWSRSTGAFLGTTMIMLCIARRDRLAIFGLVWFVVSLGPYVVIPNHISEYYLTVPTIGLAISLSRTIVQAPRWFSAGSAVALLLWCSTSWFIAWHWTAKSRHDSEVIQTVVLGTEQILRSHPDKIVFLSGITDTVFWSGMYDRPFKLIGASNRVFISPANTRQLTPYDDIVDLKTYTLPSFIAAHRLSSGGAVAYKLLPPDVLRNVTRSETLALSEMASAEGLPRRVEVGNPLYGILLDQRWFGVEDGAFRWMSKEASVYVRGPSSAKERLYVRGVCGSSQLTQGPIRLSASVGPNAMLKLAEITQCQSMWNVSMPMPLAVIGKSSVMVTLSVDRVQKEAGGERLLGIGISEVEVR